MWFGKKSTPEQSGPLKPGELRSFGRLTSRMTRADVSKLAARLDPYLIQLPTKGVLRRRDMFSNPRLPLVLEIGCGHGHYLWHRATTEPDKNFLGVEVYQNGLKSLVHKLEQRADSEDPVKNLKLCDQDGRQVLELLPDRALLQLAVLYPDPWPKRRHHKRRIISAEFLAEAARIIQPGGELLVVTDIADYAHWSLERVLANKSFEWLAESPAAIATPPFGWPGTKYEQKAQREGRDPWYLRFTRTEN